MNLQLLKDILLEESPTEIKQYEVLLLPIAFLQQIMTLIVVVDTQNFLNTISEGFLEK
jgi:hypothetical protein